ERDVIAVQSGTDHKKDTKEEDVFSESHTDPAPSRYDSHIEDKLKELWCGVLGCEDLSAADDFFDLCGHSLKAITLASEIEDMYAVDIPLSDMFNHSAFQDMVDYIQANAKAEPESAMIVPVAEKEYYEVSSAQKRMYIVHEMMSDG